MNAKLTSLGATLARKAWFAGATTVRVLTGAFFLATAAALHIGEPGATILDGVLSAGAALSVTALFLAVTGLALVLRIAVRPAAVLLMLYVAATGYLRIRFGAIAAAPVAVDAALLGALFVTTLGESPRPPAIRIVPRRVAKELPVATIRPDRAEERAAHEAIRAVAPTGTDYNPRNVFDVWDADKNAA